MSLLDATWTQHRDNRSWQFSAFTAARRWLPCLIGFFAVVLIGAPMAWASEADLAIPDLHQGKFIIFGSEITAWNLLAYGALVICGTLGISLYQFFQIKKQPAHQSMLDIAEIIFQTCKTYLLQQGKFLLMLWALIAICITYYLLQGEHAPADVPEGAAAVATEAPISPMTTVVLVLLFSLVGMGGSYAVA